MSIFIHNKYRKIYIQIIKKAKSENRIKLPRDHLDYIYYENHHILPKCDSMFPQYKDLRKYPRNGVLLTGREHFIVHWLLIKMVSIGYKASMQHAFSKMSNVSNNTKERYRITSTQFAILKKHNAQAASFFHKGRKHSKEHCEKISKSLKGKNTWTKGTPAWNQGIPMTQAAKDKASSKLKGRKTWNKGKIFHTDEAKLRIGAAHKNIPKPKVTCPHCQKQGGKPVMIRHHFDNCKQNHS